MSTPSKVDNKLKFHFTKNDIPEYIKKDIPGNIQGSLLNILNFDTRLLSQYGLELATIFLIEKEKHESDLKKAAMELDALWEED